ncbi:hypothetical protein QA597_07100 [Marinilabiliaceae bacterium ANBcel2]|nr:hypothetical protein [Marinilabiliaceae bacterium ANBcel2]
MKTVLQILLTIAIILLAYMAVESINRPVRFQQEYESRRDKVIERLKEIRSAQVAYRSMHGEFTSSFDTLSNFIAEDSLVLVRMEGNLTDSMLDAGMTERQALDLGIISRDTIRRSVKDSLFRNKSWILDSISYIPYSQGEKFEMEKGNVETASGIKVPVFQAQAHNNTFTKDLNRQEVININDRQTQLDRYPGLRVGSIEQANNNAGNWE